MKSSQILAAVFSLSSLSTAWPWPPSLPDFKGLTGMDLSLERRAAVDNSKKVASKPSPAASAKSPAETKHTTVKNKKPSKTSSNKHSSMEHIPVTAQPGALQMIQPPITSGSQYYRVDTTVTWVWNYTRLIRTPSNIDIVATVSESSLGVAPSPFTLAVNQSFAKTQTFTWDTGEYYTKTSRLPVGIYTLMVYDSDLQGGSSAIPSAGYLEPFAGFYFGVYTPTPLATPHPEYQCITCNAAGGKMQGLTMGFLFGTAGVTMGTFLYFALVNGII